MPVQNTTQLRSNIKRIMIIDRPGSGKSTFAVQLQKKLKVPLFHLDKYFFEKNWIESNYQEFLSLQKEMISNPGWIIDGNSTKSYEMRYKKAELCLYFNFPRLLCIGAFLSAYFISIQVLMIEHQNVLKQYVGHY